MFGHLLIKLVLGLKYCFQFSGHSMVKDQERLWAHFNAHEILKKWWNNRSLDSDTLTLIVRKLLLTSDRKVPDFSEKAILPYNQHLLVTFLMNTHPSTQGIGIIPQFYLEVFATISGIVFHPLSPNSSHDDASWNFLMSSYSRENHASRDESVWWSLHGDTLTPIWW